ncbi:hypothetical protein ACFSJT_00020 [Aquimarina celericrescens]|uniref:SH3b domain-containing protein n=2 Tax=Aquimarina celericrescens TaxID=1964542 RepID=A0ABW5AQA7_9FLAO|nr:hypothetical protein [Aquimarina celericrescens]
MTKQVDTEKKVSSVKQDKEVLSSNNKGYLFIEISKIYHNQGEFSIQGEDNTSMFYFVNKNVTINGKTYDIINDEHLYKNFIEVESYFPEYGIFIIKAEKLQDGNYAAVINGNKAKIDGVKHKAILNFKTPEQYVLDGYPNPSKDNPVRVSPNESSDILPNYGDHTYKSLEINGEWLKVKDDKDCYSGEEPSKKDIMGWIRWMKNGEVIIDIRHSC